MNFANPTVASSPAVTGYGPQPDLEGMDFDFGAIWRTIYNNRLILILIPLIAILIGVAITAVTPRRYQAIATVQIEQQTSKVLSNGDVGPAISSQDSDRFLQTQLGLLNSKVLAGKIVDSLGLAKSDAALEQLGMPPKQLEMIGNTNDRRGALVAILRSGVSVTLPRDSRIAQVGFTCREPVLCAKVANGYVQELIVYNLQQRYQESSYALRFLREQLDAAKQRLQDSERATVNYAKQARLVDTGAGGQSTGITSSPTAANLVDLNGALAAAQTATIEARQRWEQSRSTPILSQPEVLQSSAIQALIEKRALAEVAYKEERQRHKPGYPSMEQAAAEIAELDVQTMQIAKATRDSLLNRYQVAQRNENEMRSLISKLKSATLDEQDTSIGYNILRREVDTNRTMYDGLLQRYKEVSAASGVTAKNISAVDSAEVPSNPVSPKPNMNLATAGIAGVMLALLVVFGREKLLDGVRAPTEVVEKLGVPLIGVFPNVSKKITPLDDLADPRSPISEASAALASTIEFALPAGFPAIMLVTSSKPGDGKSTFAYAIARSFARTDRRVLLVDGDLRRPTLDSRLGLSNDTGLSTVLTKNGSIENSIVAAPETGLFLMPAGPKPANPAGLLSGKRLTNVMNLFRQSFDLVVIDSPPVLQLADAVLFAALADVTVMIVDAQTSRASPIRTSLKRLREGTANVIGAVLTKYDVKTMEYVY